MTLVYAKIMGIFVCGAEPGVGGRGWWSRGWGDTWKCIQVGPTHRWLSVGGGGCMYICTEM